MMIQLKKRKYLAVLLIFGLLLSFGSMASAASVTPILMNLTVGNAADEVSQVGCDADYAYKVNNSAENGSYNTGDGNTITITNSDGYYFDWESEWPVTCVLVKAGSDYYNVFIYPDGAYGDTGLFAPINPANDKMFQISHVSFGYNEPEPGTLIINKILAGNDQPASDTEFTVTIGGTSETIIAGENSFSLSPGTYAIAETNSQDADSIEYSTQSAIIEENQTTTVTITNTFNTDNGGGGDPDNGTLIINKVLAGNDQPASGTEFTVTIGGSTKTIAAGDNSFSLAPGTYAIEETNSQGADSIEYSTKSAVIEENKTTTVTITNTFNTDNDGGDPDPEDGTLIVHKVVSGNDRPERDVQFTITINGEEHGIVSGDNSFDLTPGNYTVIETNDRGATSVRNRTQTAVVNEGETTTITITNIFSTSGGGGGGGDYTPPEKPEEPVTVTEPPVAAPPVVEVPNTEASVDEAVVINEESPAAAKPLPATGGPVLLYLGTGLGLCGIGLTIRRRFM